ncbi:secreted Ly-6/uPAR-related protein 1-like [Tenrec ecaudatus]|uniref:secreted Ly-6/uPAR-related protein 1-like n=1 Tax=Tenrec ecaudatus TaxID=94439 RepID=UPI003F5A7AEF
MACSRQVLTLLLLAGWLLSPGASFKCYTCEQPTAISLCRKVAHCRREDTACKITLVTVESEFPFNGSPMVTAACATSCEATDPDSIGAAHPVSCCFHNLCNVVGARR